MSKLERITVTMPEEMAHRLRAAVDEGSYATTSEIVREALRHWTAERDRRDSENAAIRDMLERARASGTVAADDVYRRLREQVASLVQESSGEAAA